MNEAPPLAAGFVKALRKREKRALNFPPFPTVDRREAGISPDLSGKPQNQLLA